MNTLRQAVREYLTMRRGLGFKLRRVGSGLLDFVTFMERQGASHITHELALPGLNNHWMRIERTRCAGTVACALPEGG